MPTDKTPAGKRGDISIREKEKEIQKDLGDGIDTIGTTELLEEFFGRYYAMYWATRTNENCGFTLKELYERGLTRQTPEQMAEERLSSWAADAVHRQGLKRKKPGRNELCPCGSGKKYKKCCGR